MSVTGSGTAQPIKKAWQREQIAKHGYFIIENGPNKGEKCTYVGSQRGHDTSKAREVAYRLASDTKIRWKETSAAYKWTMQQVAEGKPRKEIIEEFNRLHSLQPDVFCTRKGMPLTKAILSGWISEANPLALSV